MWLYLDKHFKAGTQHLPVSGFSGDRLINLFCFNENNFECIEFPLFCMVMFQLNLFSIDQHENWVIIGFSSQVDVDFSPQNKSDCSISKGGGTAVHYKSNMKT